MASCPKCGNSKLKKKKGIARCPKCGKFGNQDTER